MLDALVIEWMVQSYAGVPVHGTDSKIVCRASGGPPLLEDLRFVPAADPGIHPGVGVGGRGEAVWWWTGETLIPAARENAADMTETVVYGLDGRVLERRSNVWACVPRPPTPTASLPTLLAYTDDSPGPGSPFPFPAPNKWQASPVDREKVVPATWGPIDGLTRSNNAVGLDINSYAPVAIGPHPIDLNQHSTTYVPAAIVNAWVVANEYHDWIAEAGFGEAEGNYQSVNYSGLGVGGDPAGVIVVADKAAPMNNAYWVGTAVDGEKAWTVLGNWGKPGAAVDRHCALDRHVIGHEFTHGVHIRFGVGTWALGEGWADFMGYLFSATEDDDPRAANAIGAWSLWQFQLSGGETRSKQPLEDNYYYGVRRYPASADPQKNPLTYKHNDPKQQVYPPEVPVSPVGWGNFGGHAQGEIWCAMLMECWALTLDRHGYEDGRRRMAATVVGGMKLMPQNIPEPGEGFPMARDALILADEVLYDGGGRVLLWDSFARRGLGVGALIAKQSGIVMESYKAPDWGDYDQDGDKDMDDLIAFQADFASGHMAADLDLDHELTADDWFVFMELWQK